MKKPAIHITDCPWRPGTPGDAGASTARWRWVLTLCIALAAILAASVAVSAVTAAGESATPTEAMAATTAPPEDSDGSEAGLSGQGPRRFFSSGNRSRNWVIHARFQFATDDLGMLYDSVPTEVTYFDGLGRKIQSLSVAMDGSRDGIADFTEYDDCGRVVRQWMPTLADGSSGQFTELPVLSESYSRTGQCPREYAFSSFSYEESPLGRPVERRGPGEARHQAAHGVRTEYLCNTVSGEGRCLRFRVVGDRLRCEGAYPEGMLRVTATEDEEGNRTLVFADPFGRTALSRFIPAQGIQGAEPSPQDTYYVYDGPGRLRVVITPRGAGDFSAGSEYRLSASRVLETCVVYGYDAMDRCNSVWYPGRGETRTVYAPGGLPVYVRDANMAQSGRMAYTVYDCFNRVAYTGIDPCGE